MFSIFFLTLQKIATVSRVLLVLLIFFTTGVVRSQKIPALWQNFKNGTSKERVHACEKLSDYYSNASKDTLRILGEDLFLYGIDHHYYPAIERGKLTLAKYFLYNGKLNDCIVMTKSLLSNMEERGDDHMMAIACHYISDAYLRQKDKKSCYYWALRAQRHCKMSDDPVEQASSMTMLAEAYLLNGKTEKAIQTYKQFVSVMKPNREYAQVSSAYARLGDLYRLQENSNLAEKFFRYSMQYAQKSGETVYLAHAYNNLAITSFEKGDTAISREYFMKALELREKVKDIRGISESYYNLGDYHYYNSEMEKAVFWYRKSLDYSRKNNLKVETGDALEALARMAKDMEDFKEANRYNEERNVLLHEIDLINNQDESELADLKGKISQLEKEVEVTNSGVDDPAPEQKIRWEWIALGVMSILVVIIALWKRKRNND